MKRVAVLALIFGALFFSVQAVPVAAQADDGACAPEGQNICPPPPPVDPLVAELTSQLSAEQVENQRLRYENADLRVENEYLRAGWTSTFTTLVETKHTLAATQSRLTAARAKIKELRQIIRGG